jgi:hypothetical protein
MPSGVEMLGNMIGAKAHPIVLFDELEPGLEQIRERNPVVVKVVENAELQSHSAYSLSLFFVVRKCYCSCRELPARLAGQRPDHLNGRKVLE